MSKRHSILPPAPSGPRPPTHLSPTLTISDSAVLTGTHSITLHGETVIHPRARLDSLAGRLTVGRRCVVHERATIGAVGASGRIVEAAVTVGDYVVVEVGAVIEAGETVVGEGTVVGVGARVGAGAVVGKHCTLTPHSEIAAGEVVPDFTVVYSNGLRRTDKRGVAELKNKGLARQIDVLRRMIPSNPAKFA
ncbi:trimeric LpxA-like protein [Staphylotrichum tortipilum]|uniref:Dynactin subunit 6 n=1 Tax=Staphylotrichum tortipilum TaxID=2831512 RepID=A0AAN6MHE0_9PEZI|nr:trimeric LpxA-like protein [Staphylotrichum longicolle]